MNLLANETISTSSLVALAVTVCVAAWTDWTTWRIPNWLVAGSAAAALMLAGFAPDGIGLARCLGGAAVGFALFLPLYVVKGMAAGDVKLMAVIGMYVGPWVVVDIVLITCLIGGAWALLVTALKKEAGLLPWLWLQWQSRAGHWSKQQAGPATPAGSGRQMIPYGVVIALGTFATLW
jgi:prepilin peptidase CpaA